MTVAAARRPRFTVWRAFPADPADWFSVEEIARSKQYQRPLRVVGSVDRAARAAAALVIIGTGVPARVLDGLGVAPWWGRLLVLCALVTLFAVLSTMPAGMWRSLAYDRRWGFSTQTVWGFLADEAKGVMVLTVLLGVFGLPAWALVRATSIWWVYAWLLFAAVTTMLGLLYPVAIAPLFNRYEPLADGDLRAALLAVAQEADADVSEILVEDSSKRTTKGNAYVSGLGKTRRVVLYDTMVGHSPGQLRTVVAHEIGHWKLRHLAKTLPASIALSLVTFAVLGALLANHRVLRFAHVHRLGDPIGFVLFLFCFPVVSKISGLVQNWMSRSFEREADLFALRVTRDPINFVAAMRALHTANLNDLAPSRWKRLNDTHPQAAERLAMGVAWSAARSEPAA